MKIARGSKSWILSVFLSGLIFLVLSLVFKDEEIGAVFFLICFCFFLLTVFFLVFFRDPERKIGKGVVAVADGKIREITEINDKEIGKCTMISTFMNIQNVHVNRMPLDGKIVDIKHFSGFIFLHSKRNLRKMREL
jgi:phosphatidylserine decarboxylase